MLLYLRNLFVLLGFCASTMLWGQDLSVVHDAMERGDYAFAKAQLDKLEASWASAQAKAQLDKLEAGWTAAQAKAQLDKTEAGETKDEVASIAQGQVNNGPAQQSAGFSKKSTLTKSDEIKELRADLMGVNREYKKAAASYKDLLKRYPTDADLHFKCGGALGLYAQANKAKALFLLDDIKFHLKEAVRLDPKHINAHWALVQLYVELPGIVGGSMSTAKDYAQLLMKISPVDGHLALAYVYEEDDEPSLAETHYQKAVNRGKSVTTVHKLADFYQGQSRPEAAMLALKHWCEYLNDNSLCYRVGDVSALYGVRMDSGIECLHHFLKRYEAGSEVSRAAAYYRLARLHKKKGDYETARSWITKALEDEPRNQDYLALQKELG